MVLVDYIGILFTCCNTFGNILCTSWHISMICLWCLLCTQLARLIAFLQRDRTRTTSCRFIRTHFPDRFQTNQYMFLLLSDAGNTNKNTNNGRQNKLSKTNAKKRVNSSCSTGSTRRVTHILLYLNIQSTLVVSTKKYTELSEQFQYSIEKS